jgi:primosomal protein N'
MWFFENQVEALPAMPASERRGEIRCAGCGYGAVVSRLPEHCPICRHTGWSAPLSGHDSFLDDVITPLPVDISRRERGD